MMQQRAIFDPPLSYQRYKWTAAFLESDETISTVTDAGCGNGRFVIFVKNVANVSAINCLDKDKPLLEDELDNYFRPCLLEMLFGRRNVNNHLNIKVYNGEVWVPDERLIADVFTMIEVIEHMEPADVERATRTIFGWYRPRYVVVTTPNCEFNHLLNRDPETATQFRHSDHKFEWNRKEFQQWAHSVCSQHPYTVTFDGVGHLENSEAFGPCTQIALFKLNPDAVVKREDPVLFGCDILMDRLDVKPSKGYQPPKCDGINLMAQYLLPAPEAPKDDSYTSQTYDSWSMVEEDVVTSAGQ